MPVGDDDERRRDPAWVLGEALRLADAIWQNEDRNVEHQPGYDVEVTVSAAVELAGAVKALDGLLENGYPLPHSWRKIEAAVADGEVHEFQLSGWRLVAWRLIRPPGVASAVGWCERHLPGALGKVTRPWEWKQR